MMDVWWYRLSGKVNSPMSRRTTQAGGVKEEKV
jgi:hypothetical protein